MDVRVIAATNKNVEKEVAEGRLRDDLFYRLNVVRVHVVALRERAEDVGELAVHFLDQFIAKMGRSPLKISKDALVLLRRQPWPGNVRELRNVMERVALFCGGSEVGPEDILSVIDRSTDRGKELAAFKGTHGEFMEWAEARFLERRLKESAWNITKTARELEMQRSNLYKKLEKYNLQRPPQ